MKGSRTASSIKLPSLFSDDSEEGLEIYEKDASNGLSYEKMCFVRHQQHPRLLRYDIKSDTSTYALHPLCGTNTGWSHCRRNRRQSDLKDYGVGLVLYFQFQKYLVVMMFLFTLLSIPTCILFYHGSVTFVPVADGGDGSSSTEHIHPEE
jgi:hypothetical protein